MTTFQEQFGDGCKPIGLNVPNTKGEPRHCIGYNKSSPYTKWFGWINEAGIKIPADKLSFCVGCFQNYLPKDRCYEVTQKEYPEYVGPMITRHLVCDTPKTNSSLMFGVDNRCLHYKGLRVNVNAIEGENWRPVGKVPTKEAREAETKGLLTVPIPTFTSWEMAIMGDPYGEFRNSKLYYKVQEAWTGTGANKKPIKVMSKSGNTNLYMPLSGKNPLITNSYDVGEVFVFQAPSNLEVSHGMEASHNRDSNKVFLTITIHERVAAPKPVYYPQYDEHMGQMRDGGRMRSKGGGQTRGGGRMRSKGGGQMRGGRSSDLVDDCAEVSKGGASHSDYSGGSNFSMAGKSSHVDAPIVKDTFPRVMEYPPINIAIQLVNNESEEDKIYFTRLIQRQVDEERERQTRLQTRSALFSSHQEQNGLMIP